MFETIVYLTNSIFHLNCQNSTLTLCISATFSLYVSCVLHLHFYIFQKFPHFIVLELWSSPWQLFLFHLLLLQLYIICGLRKRTMLAYTFNWVGLGSFTIGYKRDGQRFTYFLPIQRSKAKTSRALLPMKRKDGARTAATAQIVLRLAPLDTKWSKAAKKNCPKGTISLRIHSLSF